MAVKLNGEIETVLWVHLVGPTGPGSERDVQTFVVYLQKLKDRFELRLTDFVQLWSKSYAGSIASESHQDLQMLKQTLAQGEAGVQVQTESTSSVTLSWCSCSQAVLASAGPVSAQELRPLVVHAVQSMHTAQQALLALESKVEHQKLTPPLHALSMATVKTGPASKAKRPPGQSIVNPLNKRKKAAGGVQFNDQET